MRSLISIFCALVYLLGCSGCALFSLEKTVHYEDPEGQFSLESITGIERGSTSEAWLFKTFGTPIEQQALAKEVNICLLYTSPSPRDLSTSRMPSSA